MFNQIKNNFIFYDNYIFYQEMKVNWATKPGTTLKTDTSSNF